MRLLILLLLFHNTTLVLQSQTSLDFIQTGANWLVEWDDTNTAWPFDGLERYYFGSDTSLNDTLYHEYWVSQIRGNGATTGLAEYMQPFVATDSSLAGLIRETLGRRVYFREFIDRPEAAFAPEVLLYDFGLELGETIALPYEDTLTVVELDQQMIAGEPRRFWRFNNDMVVIEGIGRTDGPLASILFTLLGFESRLYNYCVGVDMDCNIAVDKGLVHPLRQINVDLETGEFRGTTTITEQYRFRGDTLINDSTFLRLFKTTDPTLSDWQHTGAYFRQVDTRVYRYAPAHDIDPLLLYDFSLSIGDSLSYASTLITPGPFRADLEVTSTDNLTFADGSLHRAFTLTNPPDPRTAMYIVEGIGSLGDFAFPEQELFLYPIVDVYTRHFRCYYTDYTQDWTFRSPEIEEGPCYVYLVDTNEPDQAPHIGFFPNPVQDYMHITGESINYELQIYNLWGQPMGLYDLDQLVLDLRKLPTGIYFYQVWNKLTQQFVQAGKWHKL